MDSRSEAHIRIRTLHLCLHLNANGSVVSCSVKLQHEACTHTIRTIENEWGPSIFISAQSSNSATVSCNVARIERGAFASADLVVHRTHFLADQKYDFLFPIKYRGYSDQQPLLYQVRSLGQGSRFAPRSFLL